ncbi:MAG TPA: NAD(P)-dependent oxidoreductase [Bryobacteraceae bacterium]|jgi:nucleoside-diphosphate-sugar epimerase|nr:NAD(P)-dependent oxidoreductase [Bryobacteraceae bacterium]
MLLVTGGTGFIGSHLLERIGRPARALVRRRAVRLPEGIEAAPGDLVSGAGLEEALDGVDTIIHLAGTTKALRKGDYYDGNVRAAENLARAAAGRGIHFVHVSSLAAAGPSRDGAPVREDDGERPVSEYGRSKLEGERAVRARLPEAVIVRPPVVYGPRDTDVFQFLKSVSRGVWLEVAGGPRWFSSIYVEDLVEGLLAAAGARQAAGRTYFLSHAKACTWGEFADTAARLLGTRARRAPLPAAAAWAAAYGAEMWARATGRPGILSRDKIAEARCRYWTCDASRAASELGFQARTSLDDGLARTLAWYKEAGWLSR